MFKLPRNLMLPAIVFSVTLPFATRAVADDVVYLASWRDMLYRTTDGGCLETFDFERAIRGTHRDLATGEVWVLADNPWPTPVDSRLYRLHNPFSGIPSWTEYAVMERQYGALTQVGETWYAVSSGELYALDLSDPANPVEQYVGSFGLPHTGGLAYDPVTETLYLIARDTDNALYTLDPETADVSRIGDTGIESVGLGAEWCGGQLFAAVQNTSSGSFEIGTIDVTTGLYSPMMTLGDADRVATALTMMPVEGCPDDDGDGFVTICHIPPGNPDRARTIRIAVQAAVAHLAHGDYCGPCNEGSEDALDGAAGVDLGNSAETMGLDGTVDTACPGDLTGDNVVDLDDLAKLLGNYGMSSGAVYTGGDLDRDGDVDLPDLAELLAVYGTDCP